MKLRGFITHKAAEYYSDCADYFRICPRTKRVAVSDGVSQSIMPAEWARILVDSFVNEEWAPGESTAILKEKWLTQAKEFANEQREQGKNPWMLENCLANKDGAAATFCGVIFSDGGKWTASILGDSSLVEIDKVNHIVRICSSKEGAFDNRPDFFDSFNEDNGEIRQYEGTLNKDSKILLVSDPFSELFQKVKGTPEEVVVVKDLLAITDINSFNSIVDALRKDFQMHNDDSTLVIIEPDESDVMTILYEKTLESSLQEEKKRLEEERKELERKKEQDEELWEKTIEEDNEEAYRSYLGMSKLCTHKKEAEKRLREIAEEKAEDETWKEACSLNKIEGYQKYVELFPSGRYALEAKERINKLGRSSTHGKKPEGKDDSAESQSSEEPFCKGGEQTEKAQSLQENADMDKEPSSSPTEESAATAITQVETKPEGIQEVEVSGGEESRRKGAELAPEKAGDESGKTTYSALAACRVNTKEVEINRCEGEGSFSLPNGVDPSDGIDKVEFQKLQETALLLFKKYHERFEAAFRRQKWNSDRASGINQCFADFWCELERIIYHNKKNG